MITPVTFYAATCDNCGKQWYNDHYGWSAMNDELSLLEMLGDDDWVEEEGKNYCPSCYEYDDDDNLKIKTIDKH